MDDLYMPLVDDHRHGRNPHADLVVRPIRHCSVHPAEEGKERHVDNDPS